MSQIIDILCWWGVLGFVIVLLLVKPKDKKSALLQLFVSGPVGWFIFIAVSVEMLLKSNKQKDLK